MPRPDISLPASFHFTTEIPLRISDMNYSNHLGNDALLAVLQEARVQMLASHGWGELDIAGKGIIMADCVVLFKTEGFYGDVVVVDIAVADLESRSFTMLYRATNKKTGREIARARTGMIFFDYQIRKSVTMPNEFLTAFSPKN